MFASWLTHSSPLHPGLPMSERARARSTESRASPDPLESLNVSIMISNMCPTVSICVPTCPKCVRAEGVRARRAK